MNQQSHSLVFTQRSLKTYPHKILHAVNQNNMVLVQKQTHRSMKQERPQINPLVYGKLIYNKGAKDTQWVKTVSLINGIGTTGQLYAKE